MAPWLVMLAMVAGCGRLGFDRDSPADGPQPIDASCANPVGHDEDGDTVDDACDVCPQLADDQLDSDGDLVGDACDVSPAQQQRTLFDPFTSARPEWTFSPSVTYQADSIGLPGINDSIGIRLNGAPGRTIVEVGGRVIAGGAASRQVAIHIGSVTAPANYYCELYDGNGELFFMLTYTLDDTNFNNLDAVVIGGRLDPGAYRITFVHSPPDLTCIGEWNGVRYQVSGQDPGGVPADATFVAVNNLDTELDYFVRLTTP